MDTIEDWMRRCFGDFPSTDSREVSTAWFGYRAAHCFKAGGSLIDLGGGVNAPVAARPTSVRQLLDGGERYNRLGWLDPVEWTANGSRSITLRETP